MQPRIACRRGWRLWMHRRDGTSSDGPVREPEDDWIGIAPELGRKMWLRVGCGEPELPVAHFGRRDPARSVLEEISRGKLVDTPVWRLAFEQLQVAQPTQRDRNRALRNPEVRGELAHGGRGAAGGREEDEEIERREGIVHDLWESMTHYRI